MSYQALYRVWRPTLFRDVVGQTHITRTLQNAIAQQKFSHAYLFSGPRGTGKTSAAKIFAKTVNCEQGPTKEPCNACSACLGIQDGSISDVIEIDAASNNGVEQIRDIRDKVKYAPTSVSYKVYIIDEVHMLSIGAFNALLKTLEEPPSHVVFILATTEPHKIPLTIISRCQRFDFKRISQTAMVERMASITEEEDLAVDREALEIVALSAEGGMRDALSLLDQAISYSEDAVGTEDVLAVTGSISQQQLAALLRYVHAGEVKEALETVDALIQEGKDPGRFVFDLIYYLRDLLMYKSAPGLEQHLERAVPDEGFRDLSGELQPEWIQGSIRSLNQCQQEMKWTTSPKVFIEIALLNIADQKPGTPAEGDAETVDKLSRKIDTLEKKLMKMEENPPAVAASQQAPAPEKRTPARGAKNNYRVPYEKINRTLQEASKEAITGVKEVWGEFMEALKKRNAPAHATLLNSKPRAASGSSLVLAFRYDIHCSLALDHRATIEPLLEEFTGKPLMIIPVPEPKWQQLREEYVQKQRDEAPEEEKNAHTEDDFISEAKKLAGDDIIEIHD
ncbi:DNA polymerase III subunit gamma/tau [Salimicrobium salexigens]|uniref:DNA-directed DNA polymerase n=1 Tax=Salimicrobium salexigens TaxID=908941 RepID=A0ABY1KZY5_9BACI|nr:DNA polymerase III subunit gamma/tau [Salimicrobium salexigens]SIS98919.1 DNA polymerase-3 subunit gamma/tau [Salimicrobium salexigens]